MFLNLFICIVDLTTVLGSIFDVSELGCRHNGAAENRQDNLLLLRGANNIVDGVVASKPFPVFEYISNFFFRHFGSGSDVLPTIAPSELTFCFGEPFGEIFLLFWIRFLRRGLNY
ncbi:hypothetical protein BRD00_08235 [Halobacteriales archaeon QS_8_69_26]|nr:MAG: hypothetical protein BRD00_08235 [Halobacteriales archaeon QS_8_69_26]